MSYQYDAAGNLVEIRDPNGNTIRYEYDLRNRKIKTIDPDLGTILHEYNGFDELVKESNSKGNVVQLEYDKLGRLLKRVEEEGITVYTYDAGNKAIGKLSSLTGLDGYTRTQTYDNQGRLVSQSQVISGKTYTTQFTYNAAGRTEKVRYASGFEIQYIYNAYGYLSEIRNTANNYSVWKAEKMNARGQIEQQLSGNGVQTRQYWNAENAFLDSTVTAKGGMISQKFSYTFNQLGNLLSRTNKKYNRTEEFTYDELNRLTRSTIVGVDTLAVRYDVLGNITYKSDIGTYHYGPVNNGPHRVIRIDPAGSVCVPSLEINTDYTSFQKVKKITRDNGAELRVSYNPEYQRLVQELYQSGVLTKKKIFVSNLLEQEIIGDTVKNLHYIYGSVGVVAVLTSDNHNRRALQFWHKDHLGSLTSITDSLGNLVAELSYDAWGKRRNADWTDFTGTDTTKFFVDRGFTTHEHYDLFAIVNMNGRIYDVTLGRFLSPDPFIDDVTNLQSLNRYSYVNNNPLSFSDPSGYFKIKKVFKSVVSAARVYVSVVNPVLLAVDKKGQTWVKENWKQVAVTAVAIGVSAALGPGAGLLVASAAGGFTSGFLGAMLNGSSTKDALKAGLKSAVISAVSAGLTQGVGDIGGALGSAGVNSTEVAMIKAVGHGLVQGGVSKVQGGEFSSGFWSGAVASIAGEQIVQRMPTKESQIFTNAIVGGTTAEISGGKFASGAMSAAFIMIFNHHRHPFDESADALSPLIEDVQFSGGAETPSVYGVSANGSTSGGGVKFSFGGYGVGYQRSVQGHNIVVFEVGIGFGKVGNYSFGNASFGQHWNLSTGEQRQSLGVSGGGGSMEVNWRVNMPTNCHTTPYGVQICR